MTADVVLAAVVAVVVGGLGWSLCKYVLGPGITLFGTSISELIEGVSSTLAKLFQETRIVTVASMGFASDLLWLAILLIGGVLILSLIFRTVAAFWSLRLWRVQTKEMQERVARELQSIESISEKSSDDYRAGQERLREQIQSHVDRKSSEETRARDNYNARRQAIENECSVLRQQQRLTTTKLSPLQAFELGRETERMESTKGKRLAEADQQLNQEMQQIEMNFGLRTKATESELQELRDRHLQKQALREQQLLQLQNESQSLRQQLPTHFRAIVGESTRMLDQSLQDVSSGLLALKDRR